ncbi:MAG: ABC transporter ATP-binding protein [Bacteroidota bacterium]
MEQPIINIAQSLKRQLQQNAVSGAKALVDFANDYAVNKELRYEALVLSMNFSTGGSEAERMGFVEEMQQLVDKILKDNQSMAAAAALKAEKAALAQLQEHYRSIPAPNAVVFESENLGKSYAKGFQLKGVNLQLREGEITSVVGENGNGKTTLFRLVAGELQHDAGKLRYPAIQPKGGRIDWVKVKAQVAYVTQELSPWYGSLKQNLQFEAAIHGIKGKDNDREVKYIIQRLGLKEERHKTWEELSGGFKLRFALAKALVWKPKLLIIDEPLANLDYKTQELILSDLRNMANSLRYPMSVLISSQHLHEIQPVSDKVLFLKKGSVGFYGPQSELGRERTYNSFELGSELSLVELQKKMKGIATNKIYFNGISYVITTSLDLEYEALIQQLIQREIPFYYFRDISKSIKQLFG